MKQNKGQVGVWIFLAFIVLLIGIFLLFVFLHGSEPSKVSSSNVSVNLTYFNVSINFRNIVGDVPVSYVLTNYSFDSRGGFDGESCVDVSPFLVQGFVSNGSDSMGCPIVGRWVRGSKLVSGLFFSNSLEFFRGGVVANSTVLLEGFSDFYYYNSTICNVSSELFSCNLSLTRKATDYSVGVVNHSLVLNISGGTVQLPIVCSAFSFNVANVYVGNLSPIPVPKDLHWLYDECYVVGHDLVNDTVFPLVVRRQEFCDFNVVLPLSFVVRDYEVDGKNNIGDRNFSSNVRFVDNTSWVVN